MTGRRAGSRARWSSRCPTASTPARRRTASPSTSRWRRSGRCGRRTSSGSCPPSARSWSSRCCARCRSRCARRSFRSPTPRPRCSADVKPRSGPLLEVLAEAIERLRGVRIGAADWSLDALPAHLRMTFVDRGRRRDRARVGPVPRRAARRAAAGAEGASGARRCRRSRAMGCAASTSSRCRARSTSPAACAASRRSSTRATRSGSGSARPRASRP